MCHSLITGIRIVARNGRNLKSLQISEGALKMQEWMLSFVDQFGIGESSF